MEQEVQKLRNAICDVCQKLWQRGIVAANDGNVSAMLSDGTILCTPSGISKAAITPEMLLHVKQDMTVLEALAGMRPSSELKMHIRCYKERPDVRAVVHAHPPIATSFASLGMGLDDYKVMETIVQLGAVPVAPYAKPSSDEVPESIAPFLQNHDAVLLAHHGALTVGESLKTAYFRMETLEMFAKTSLYMKLLGGGPDLPQERIDELLDLRENGYHIQGRHPGYEKLPGEIDT